jgi:hypothetical protein
MIATYPLGAGSQCQGVVNYCRTLIACHQHIQYNSLFLSGVASELSHYGCTVHTEKQTGEKVRGQSPPVSRHRLPRTVYKSDSCRYTRVTSRRDSLAGAGGWHEARHDPRCGNDQRWSWMRRRKEGHPVKVQPAGPLQPAGPPWELTH